MEREYYSYIKNDTVDNGCIIKDEKNRKYRTNRDKYGNLKGGQLEMNEKGELEVVRYIDKNENCQTFLYKNGEVIAKFQEKVIDDQYIMHGDYERYRDGYVTEVGRYEYGKKEGQWISLEKNNGVSVKRFSEGKDVTGIAEEKLKKELAGNVEEVLGSIGDDPRRAAKRLLRNFGKLISSYKKEPPLIKIDFEETPEVNLGTTEEGYCTFYKDGSPKLFSAKVTRDLDGNYKHQGKFMECYDNGKKKKDCEYNELGNLIKDYKEYYENGELKYQGKYSDGIKHGIFQEFSEEGDLKIRGRYFQGTRLGKFVEYGENGNSIEKTYGKFEKLYNKNKCENGIKKHKLKITNEHRKSVNNAIKEELKINKKIKGKILNVSKEKGIEI